MNKNNYKRLYQLSTLALILCNINQLPNSGVLCILALMGLITALIISILDND